MTPATLWALIALYQHTTAEAALIYKEIKKGR